MADVDKIGRVLLEVNESKDHPQFQDPHYRARRDFIATVAREYRMGQSIPDVAYSPEETELWRTIYGKLSALHQRSMSGRFLEQSRELDRALGISKRIPQLGELSSYLQARTGFRIKPTHGILSQREFLNAFAFKVFCSTQYLRNVKNPDYTPEPDIVHEIVGHVPMFADPAVAVWSKLCRKFRTG
jgi:phenylalanine-4-hydroxylase